MEDMLLLTELPGVPSEGKSNNCVEDPLPLLFPQVHQKTLSEIGGPHAPRLMFVKVELGDNLNRVRFHDQYGLMKMSNGIRAVSVVRRDEIVYGFGR